MSLVVILAGGYQLLLFLIPVGFILIGIGNARFLVCLKNNCHINTPRYTLYYITSYKSTKKPLYIKRYSGFSSDYRYTIRECRLHDTINTIYFIHNLKKIMSSTSQGIHIHSVVIPSCVLKKFSLSFRLPSFFYLNSITAL